MKTVCNFLISAVRAALTDCKAQQPPENFDWKRFAKLTKRHKVSAIVSSGLYASGIVPPKEIKDKLELETSLFLLLDVNQKTAAAELFQGFESHRLAYMPMKGYNIKKFYPKSYMRYMCDIDILIDDSRYAEYSSVMADLGYVEENESDHEHIFTKKPLINIELHKRIVPSYDTDLYGYYGDGWSKAEKASGEYGYSYSGENQYIYLVVHLAKHYRSAGIGLIHFIDLYVINSKTQYDRGYIDSELKNLGLYEFHQNILKLLGVWFCGSEDDKTTAAMTRHIFLSGAYGNAQNRAAAETLRGVKKYGNKKASHRAKKMEMIFPSPKALSESFPVLKKHPALYPFLLLFRNVRALLFRRKKATDYMEKIKPADEKQTDMLASHLEDVGLKNKE